MRSHSARLAALAVLPLVAAAPALAFDVQSLGGGGVAASEDFWQRFTLDRGQSAGIALRGYRLPQFAPTLTPMVGLNYENAQMASAVRGAWLEAARVGSFAVGPVVAVERHLSLTNRSQALGGSDNERATRFGAFLAFTDAGQEVGRLSFSTGRLGGVDIRASRSFKLTDTVSLDVGPVISLGSFERFGYTGPASAAQFAPSVTAGTITPDRAQLGAFGLATAIESRVNDRTVARMFAEYARIDAQRPGVGAGPLQNRDRLDFGFSLSTRIGQ